MVDGQLLMWSFRWLTIGLVGLLLAGCEPSPSVPLAPDKPLPDTSKMSDEEIQKLHQSGSEGTDRASENTPPDRQLGG